MRRSVVLAVAGAVAAAGAIVALTLQDTQDLPAAAVPGPTALLQSRGPVLLIPGYGGETGGFNRLIATLNQQGVSAEVVNIGNGTGDLTVYANQVLVRAQRLLDQGAPSVDLIGFSAGGVIARAAATSQSGRPLIRKVVTIGAPHEGTALASLGFGECPPACRQLQPGSDFLKSLPDANATDRWLSIWSDDDEVIVPPTSSVLPGATDLRLQSICARDVPHNALLDDGTAIVASTSFLTGNPAPTSCVG